MDVIKSFCRYEKKYLLDKERYEKFRFAAENIIRPDIYGKYTICSIYLDTEDDMFIKNSIGKPVYKEKLRIRSYGIPETGEDVYFEIKKKFDGVVYKRRISVSEKAALEYAAGGGVPENIADADRQIFSEIDYIMRKYRPEPKIYIAYERRAFEGINDPTLRVTFDSGIRSRTENLSLSAGDRGKPLELEYDYRLMEIKTADAVPYELARILSELEIYPCAFSKYGEIYKQSILPQHGSERSNAIC